MSAVIHASVPVTAPPAWALAQRRLLNDLSAAVDIFAQKYALPDGGLRWGGRGDQHGRDDKDDFYEAFYNWPLLYVLGGNSDLLEKSHVHWNGVTRQLAELGLIERDFDLGADFFHQGEGLLFLYYLCLADPENPALRERMTRFADFYTGDDDRAANYDSGKLMIRAPHTGSRGPRFGFSDRGSLDLPQSMSVYGLPLEDVPGVKDFATLLQPAAAVEMLNAMNDKFGRGDVAANLGVTSLVAMAYLMTGDSRYQSWVTQYVGAWMDRATANGGLLPDNVGPGGAVGENFEGRWYGGLYGWSWPHGFYSMAQSAAIAATNAVIVSGDPGFIELAAKLLDNCLDRAFVADARALPMSLIEHWLPMLGFACETDLRAHAEAVPALVLPYRRNSGGWFDPQPFMQNVASTLWILGGRREDAARLQNTRALDPRPWDRTDGALYKEDAGHEAPWLSYLAGDYPSYPEDILALAAASLRRRLALIGNDQRDLTVVGDDEVHNLVHHWQKLNPVTTEALVQLTMGSPQVLYNGGLLAARLRYFDIGRCRPGLPEDVAALVTAIDGDGVCVTLINLNVTTRRALMIQGGAFAQHSFSHGDYDVGEGLWPGSVNQYLAPKVTTAPASIELNGPYLRLEMPPSTRIDLRLRMGLNSGRATCQLPPELVRA